MKPGLKLKHRISFICLFIILLTSATSLAQKKPIKVDDYGRFRSISSVGISEKGKWLGYSYLTPRQDDTLIIKMQSGEKLYTVPCGSSLKFSDNERWAAYKTSPTYKKQLSLKKEKKAIVSKAILLNLETGEKTIIDNQSQFAFNKGSNILTVYLAKKDPKSLNKGRELVIIDLANGNTIKKSDITEYKLNKSGAFLAYTVESPDSLGNGLFLLNIKTGNDKPLDTGRDIYSRLTWNEKGSALAVLKGITPKGKLYRSNSFIAFSKLDTETDRFEYIPESDNHFPKGYVISENGTLTFSDDLSNYYFGISKQGLKPPKKKDADPIANVDIWHWNDEKIQSVQKKQLSRDKKFTYISGVTVSEKRFIPLADSTMKIVTISRNGLAAIGRNDKPYISDWKPRLADYYAIDLKTGKRKLIKKGLERSYGFSPDSKNYLFWIDNNFWNYEISSGKLVNITEATQATFTNELFDRAGIKPPYGMAGWTKDGKNVVLYSRYDIWLQALDGTKGKNITQGKGTEKEIQLRYIKTDKEAKFIDLNKEMHLSAYGYWTKKAGFYSLSGEKLKELVYSNNRYGNPVKPLDADMFLFTRESPSEYPDYYLADLNFKKIKKVSSANPIVSEFRWYHNELIEYTNKDGVRLQGVLMVPDGYKKGDKYPMLVDFYEKNSQNLNRWSRIIYRDTPMFPKYASNGYLVLLPDIHFNINKTHSDMLECIEAAVRKVDELAYVDMDKIGIHGHSFSGQGGNYIVTHSDMFAAAVIGAGVSDLLADFNQLWKSSGSNQHRYDYYGQGRFNTNPYDNFDLFVDQSAVFHARDMNTPLLLFQGEADGSVEWLQAIEFYNGLRFNGKNVILCSYPGEGHHLSKWENKVDFQTRMEQFYNHYLKGEKAPEWMIKGIPYLKKASNNN